MEPRPASEGGCAWIAKREGGRPVGEHGSLTVRFNHHHNAGAATTALQERFNSSAHQRRLKGFSGGVLANRADEARGAPSCHRRHRDVGGAAAAPSRDLGCGVGASSPRGVQPHGDLVNQVAHTDDQWGRSGWVRSVNHAGECIGYSLAPWAVSSVG